MPTILRTLPNGAHVFAEAVLPDREGLYPASVVLAQSGTEWVTWLCMRPVGREDFCEHGYYFMFNRERAEQDFRDRVQRGR